MNHLKIAELLPWYVNGTLAPAQREAVEKEIESCELCASDLETLKALQKTMLDVEAHAPGPSQFLINRTLANIEEIERKREPQKAGSEWWRGLSAGAKAAVLVASLALVLIAGGTLVRFTSAPNGQMALPPPQPVAMNALKAGPVADRYSAGAAGPRSAMEADQVTREKSTSSAVNKPPFERPQIIRTGSMSLLVPDVEKTIARLQEIAQAQFGDVLALDDTTPSQPGERHIATLKLSVPQDRFTQTMDAVAKLGGVQTRSVAAEDVTNQIVDSQARLKNLRHTEEDLLRIMDRQGKVADLLDVQNQISSTRDEIEQLDAQLKSMQHRVAYSALSISLEDEIPAALVGPGAGTQLGDAWQTALRDSKELALRIGAGVLRVVAFAPYWGVPIALFWWLVAWLRRRPAY
jgi:acetolactate synthase small subunit